LEVRELLSALLVSNLNDSGPGSLRQAILDADAAPGAQVINFSVSGTITLTSGDLPPIINSVNIDGTTAPGFAGQPVVEIDYGGFAGLSFNAGSAQSALRSLALVGASGAGVTLNAPNIAVVGNFIGVTLDGTTADGNAGDGLVVNAGSYGNIIGAPTTLVAFVNGNALSLASNVISGNQGNGISVHGSSDNTIAANYIGTDASGTHPLANAGNGIQLDGYSHGNVIGGTICFGDAQGQVPHGNLVSGNGGYGVLLTGGSSSNFLGSNFIGTNITGNWALGNALDGVAVFSGSNANLIAGDTLDDDPLDFANIIAGNLGNGLHITDSDYTLIYANSFGLGVDGQTPVGNALDGLLIDGASSGTQVGCDGPLGNVSAANGSNGVEISGTAQGTVIANLFAGLSSTGAAANLGNKVNGVRILSTGGNNVVRSSVISGNTNNGVAITGEATGVQVIGCVIGLNAEGDVAIPNGGNGVAISGDAHGNAVGGPWSGASRNTISANRGSGVSITQTAHNNTVVNNYLGADSRGRTAMGNAWVGVYIGPGAYSNTVGGVGASLGNLISGNLNSGVQIYSASGNTLAGNLIGVQAPGRSSGYLPLPNGDSGVLIVSSSGNTIGGTTDGAGNVIADNVGSGVYVNSGSGNAILRNSIYANQGGGIVLLPGANDNQAAPTLTSISRGWFFTTIYGQLTGAPYSPYHIELFANTPDGQTYLGSKTVYTNSQGVATFSGTLWNRPSSTVYTATATSAARNTSSFSNGVS
jgi:parallel beta-helix repeat protein